MRFLPAENMVYKTNLKEDEEIKQLSDCVEPGSIILNFLLWFRHSVKFNKKYYLCMWKILSLK